MSMPHSRPCVHPETRNPAVHRCCQARNRVLADCKGLNIPGYEAAKLASEGYLAALPDLSTTQDVKDYAACIQHAVAIQVIAACDAPALLSTARVVMQSVRAEESRRVSEAKIEYSNAKITLAQAREERQKARLKLVEPAQPAA
jgi:hypothetical protein